MDELRRGKETTKGTKYAICAGMTGGGTDEPQSG
jgi:hypothetical protein